MGDILTGLQLQLRFNEASGSTINDYSGNNRNALFNGGPFVTVAAPAQFGGTAVLFDSGNTQNAEVLHDAALNPTSAGWTLAAWINTSGSAETSIFNKTNAGFVSGYEYYLNADGALHHVARPVGVNHQFGSPDVNTGAWVHFAIAASCSGGNTTSKYYVNGVLGQTFGPTAHTPTANSSDIVIGSRFLNDTYLTGALYDLRFYNRPLELADVGDLFTYQYPDRRPQGIGFGFRFGF